MANRIKKDRFVDLNTINPGNWTISVDGIGNGPSSLTGFKKGIEIPAGGYAIYTDGLNVRTATDDTELIFIINKLGASVTTRDEALKFAKNRDILVLNNPIDSVITDGLVTYLDAKHKSSYPGGSVWYSLHGHKPLNELRVLGYSQHETARPFYNWFASNCIMTNTTDIMSLTIDQIKNAYDVVVVDAYVWSFNSTVMQRLKDLVDNGVSCVGTGNDNRTNVFVSSYSTAGRQVHDIIVENEAPIGFGGQSFNYGSGDVFGGISSLANGAVPVYRRADGGLITGFIYDNYETGASLYFDQEGQTAVRPLVEAGIDYVLKNIGNKTTFVNDPVYNEVTKSFSFDEANEYFDLSQTAVENLDEDLTLMGFCKQGPTGAPHQTIISTATDYRSGAKLMSRYHGQAAFWIGNNDGTDSYVLGSGVDITDDGQWHHLAATRNSETGEIKVYVDGELKNSTEYVTGPLSMLGNSAVGVDYHSKGYHHTGDIASIKAYNRVLSDDEIKQSYYGSNLVTTSNPRLVIDPANNRSFQTGDSGLTDLAVGGDQFIIEGSGSKVDENGGILRLNEGRIYRPQVGWYGKMAMSWWMRYNGTPKNVNFYTESHRTVSGCARIYSPILADGRFQFQVWDNSSSSLPSRSISATTTTNVCDGEWHQVTCQWSNGSGNLPRGLFVYVNGFLEGYSDMIGNDGGYQHIHLGGSFGCTGDNIHNVDFGPIVHYKNYNLSESEVHQNYSAHAARFK